LACYFALELSLGFFFKLSYTVTQKEERKGTVWIIYFWSNGLSKGIEKDGSKDMARDGMMKTRKRKRGKRRSGMNNNHALGFCFHTHITLVTERQYTYLLHHGHCGRSTNGMNADPTNMEKGIVSQSIINADRLDGSLDGP